VPDLRDNGLLISLGCKWDPFIKPSSKAWWVFSNSAALLLGKLKKWVIMPIDGSAKAIYHPFHVPFPLKKDIVDTVCFIEMPFVPKKTAFITPSTDSSVPAIDVLPSTTSPAPVKCTSVSRSDCPRSITCPLTHDHEDLSDYENDSTSSSRGRPESPVICRFYQKGRCNRGSSCRYSHTGFRAVCRFYAIGRCKKGDECEYKHY
jgi:CCCH-type zinc finger